ncbi:sensor domain-containing diguanylate cyclase [Shewanella avicenniae]|uniref:Sensor domain-containing diguanylate cyclase n=1 Tax=Shewanella avicenniae TaxID=2814294 RepID=A0ABX7QP98_9GAMM|nr:sensor domain-containing diguanylate cyclase [Shewanella avicenniae]QSX33297.1 sensor domain-containing diguanylate cyclase [Shewanella avicenniae]
MDKHLKKLQQLEHENARLKLENARLSEKLNAALDGTGLCLWEHHLPTGQLTIFNMEWGQMLGFHPQELAAHFDTWKRHLHPDDYDLAVGAFEDLVNGKASSYQAVHRMLHKNGSHSWVADRGRVVEFSEDGTPLRVMGTHVDITQEKRYELALAKLASTDPLTGLLNRAKLEQEFSAFNQAEIQQQAVLVFIDLDNFKQVNDQFGHHAGDKVLIQVAEWLNVLAPANALVARMGGDEFVLLCSYCNISTIKQLTTQLLACSTQPIKLENGLAEIGFSIGVCEFTTPHADFNALYQRADHAMYQVKKNGKNGVVYLQADSTSNGI